MNKTLKIGEIAPDFELPSWKNDLIKLSHLRGRYVVLFFIESIEKENDFSLVKEFNQRNEDFIELGSIVVGITTDDSSTLQEAVNKQQIELLLLSDVLTTVHQQYHAMHSKRSKSSKVKQKFNQKALVIDQNGIILNIFERKEQEATDLSKQVLSWMKSILTT